MGISRGLTVEAFPEAQQRRQLLFDEAQVTRRRAFKAGMQERQKAFDTKESMRQATFDKGQQNRRNISAEKEKERMAKFVQGQRERQTKFLDGEEARTAVFRQAETYRATEFAKAQQLWEEDFYEQQDKLRQALESDEDRRQTNFKKWEVAFRLKVEGVESSWKLAFREEIDERHTEFVSMLRDFQLRRAAASPEPDSSADEAAEL